MNVHLTYSDSVWAWCDVHIDHSWARQEPSCVLLTRCHVLLYCGHWQWRSRYIYSSAKYPHRRTWWWTRDRQWRKVWPSLGHNSKMTRCVAKWCDVVLAVGQTIFRDPGICDRIGKSRVNRQVSTVCYWKCTARHTSVNKAVLRQWRHYDWLRARWLAGALQRDYWESSCGQTWTKWLRMYRTALFSWQRKMCPSNVYAWRYRELQYASLTTMVGVSRNKKIRNEIAFHDYLA